MKKLTLLSAVSLVAIMAVGTASAANPLASTSYVDGGLATKQAKSSADLSVGTQGGEWRQLTASDVTGLVGNSTYQAYGDSTVATGTYNHITAGNNVGANLVKLNNDLDVTNQNVATNTSNISGLQGRVTTAEGNITANTNAIGTLSSLTTGAQGNLVAAINEINTAANTSEVEDTIDSTHTTMAPSGHAVSTAITGVQSQITAEQTRAEAAESGIQGQITTEVARATAADTFAAGNYNYVNDNGGGAAAGVVALDTALAGVQGQVDSLATTASNTYQLKTDSTVDANDMNYISAGVQVGNNLEALDRGVQGNAVAIATETSRATQAEAGIQGQITTEVGRATAAETGIQGQITAEVGRAQNVEGSNTYTGTNYVSSATNLTGAITALDTALAGVQGQAANSIQGVQGVQGDTAVTTVNGVATVRTDAPAKPAKCSEQNQSGAALCDCNLTWDATNLAWKWEGVDLIYGDAETCVLP